MMHHDATKRPGPLCEQDCLSPRRCTERPMAKVEWSPLGTPYIALLRNLRPSALVQRHHVFDVALYANLT